MSTKITNITPVCLIDPKEREVTWIGLFGDFVSDNSMEQDEIEEIASTLSSGRTWICGGGAAPIQILALYNA